MPGGDCGEHAWAICDVDVRELLASATAPRQLGARTAGPGTRGERRAASPDHRALA